MNWISTETLAALMGIAPRNARRGLALNFAGKTWNNSIYKVRIVKGRGGHSGKCYEVALSSLPIELQDLWKATHRDDELLKKRVLSDGSQEANWKLEIVLPIVAHKFGTTERASAYQAIEGQNVRNHRGQKITLREDTVRRWVKKYDDAGSIQGLMTRGRSDKGKDRVLISRKWDKSVPFNDAVKREISEYMSHFIGAMLADRMSFAKVRWAVPVELRRVTEEKGYKSDNIRNICALPDQFITKQRKYKALAVFKYDKKTYQDGRPSINRANNLKPMEVVCFDVHHIDVVVKRADGTDVYPKLIAALDLGTGRFWWKVVFPKKGKMVSNADVIEAFAEMCADESWGVPKFVYADNGSEYNCLDFFSDIIGLNSILDKLEGTEVGRVIRALPYAAQSKPIEAVFNKINQAVTKHIPGYVGGDRMKPMMEKIGRTPHGKITEEEFLKEFTLNMGIYDKIPSYGKGKNGLSPNAKFGEFVEKGWQAVTVQPWQIGQAVSKPRTLVFRQHRFQWKKRHWWSDKLLEHLEDEIIIDEPKYRMESCNVLAVYDRRGKFLDWAIPDKDFDTVDGEGAKEVSRRRSIESKVLTALAKEIEHIEAKPRTVMAEKAAEEKTTIPNKAISSANFGGIGKAPDFKNLTSPAYDEVAAKRDARKEADIKKIEAMAEKMTRKRKVT